MTHTTSTDSDAIALWRTRHELLKQALMRAERQMKRANYAEAQETVKLALRDDKKVQGG